MAAPLNKRCAENTRTHIKTVKLAKRLQKHALGQLELSTSQIRAAEILLKKTLPDMQVTALTGPEGRELFPQEVGVIGRKPETTDT